MTWWLSARRHWAREQARLVESYPRASWVEDRKTGLLTCWLAVAPLPPEAELRDVIADLEAQRTVGVGLDGQLRHLATCSGPHTISKLCFEPLCLRVAPRDVRLRLAVPSPPAWPRLHCLDPLITRARYPRFPHLMADDAACAIYSPDGSWDPARGDGPLEYLDKGVIWVFKALLWIATQGTTGDGEWLGPHATGDPRDDLRDVAPSDPCLCGSGQPFGGCCRDSVAQRAGLYDRRGVPRGARGVVLG